MDEKTKARFWAKVDKRGPDECWLWTAHKNVQGYGQFGVPCAARFVVKKAHRVAWELANGPVPAGLLMCHNCDNPSCVNPTHLFPGTHLDNNRDRDRKGRHRPLRGETNGQSKLTAEAVSEIRSMRIAGATLRAIAARFGVAHTNVARIVRGEAWRADPASLTTVTERTE